MIENRQISNEEFVKKLNEHPDLRMRMESLLLAIEDEKGELKTVDDIEIRVIELVRQTGKDVIKSWAETKIKKESEALEKSVGIKKDGKKNSIGTPHLVR